MQWVRYAIITSTLLLALMTAKRAVAGAPREGDHFVNTVHPLPRGGIDVALPFLARKAWATLFTRTGAPLVPYDPTAMLANPSITWIGHATMLVRMDGVTFVTDPMFSERASPLPFAGPKRLVAPGVPLDVLPRIDFATLSHDHYDHTDLPSIRALARRGVRFVVPLGLAALLRDEAQAQVDELDWWQSIDIGPLRITCVPAQHFSGRGVVGHDRRLWSGWIISGPTRRFYHAGDTGYGPDFLEIGKRFGPIDLASIPIGAYEPRAMMRAVHANPEEAIQIARDVGARHAVGMHFGTFDLTDEPPDEPPKRFQAAAAAQSFAPDAAWILNIGETRRW